MPQLTNRLPSYRYHKSSGMAIVTLNGRDVYLGRHNSPESRAEYDRVIKAWLDNGRKAARSDERSPTDLTVNGLLLSFWQFAKGHYRVTDRNRSSELNNDRDSLQLLRSHFGGTVASSFSAPNPLRTFAT
jgi:hypothetical protein